MIRSEKTAVLAIGSSRGPSPPTALAKLIRKALLQQLSGYGRCICSPRSSVFGLSPTGSEIDCHPSTPACPLSSQLCDGPV